MNYKGMKVYGTANMSRPYKNLSDKELAAKRAAVIAAKTDVRAIIDLNNETQMRLMTAGGADFD